MTAIQPDEPKFFPEREDPTQADDLLQELEDSIPQGRANDTGLVLPVDTDLPEGEVDVLDMLLNESLAQVRAKEQYKKDREAAKRGYVGLSKEEVEFCNSRMRAFELAREWDADRCVAVWTQFVCAQCDTGQTIFTNLLEHWQHRHVRSTQRWVQVTETKVENIESVVKQVTLPMCLDCASQFVDKDDPQEMPWFEDVVLGGEGQE